MVAHPVRIGLLGCGNVGAAFAKLVAERADAIESVTGLRLEVTRVAVRSAVPGPGRVLRARRAHPRQRRRRVRPRRRPRRRGDRGHRTGPGVHPRQRSRPASRSSPPTRNSSPTSEPSCSSAAEAAGVDLLFEAAVAGAIPIIRPLRESLLGERIKRVMGIVNGTTNFILTRMTESGVSYARCPGRGPEPRLRRT